jgi:lipopolysaccharide export system permease protein
MPKFFNPLYPLISRISVMDRYIASELFAPFLFGMGFFSSLGVTIGSLFDLMRRSVDVGLPAMLVLKVLLLSLPQFMAYAFAASTLLATLLTYSRLSSDSELVALRSCGISVYRLVAPAIILGFFITGIAFTFNEYVVPAANYQAKVTLDRALNKEKRLSKSAIFSIQNILSQTAQWSKRTVLKRLFYAEKLMVKKCKV